MALNPPLLHTLLILLSLSTTITSSLPSQSLQDSPPYLWPLPAKFSSGDETLSVDPSLSLTVAGNGGGSPIVRAAFDRYMGMIFKHAYNRASSLLTRIRFLSMVEYDITSLKIIVHSDSEELQLGVDESYTLMVSKNNELSIVGAATIEANTVYGALRGLETFSQLCAFDYLTKSVQIYKAPWFIQDKPRFQYRGLLIDTSRHFLPVDVIKQIIESMSFAKLNVLHWHIVDEQSFPFETPTYPNLWKGAYSRWERYTVEDASEIVRFAKMRGINVMAELDVPGHAESWGTGYPDLWPSPSCREPLDVTKNFTFDVISGILADMRKIFPFEFFHLGGDEVNTDCWKNTTHVKEWLQGRNFTSKDAYKYFVLRSQQIAISKNWTPVNWEETFSSFGKDLDPRTVVQNWLVSDICQKAVAKGFRCIFSNQGYWYLDHLDVPWDQVYNTEPLNGIHDPSQQKLVIGGEVCMWERMWSTREAVSKGNITLTALPRLHYFRCLLNNRGVPAAPVDNWYARRPPSGPGSCYAQ
ncbi:hypothetical protein HID58_060947 [Brassica napus]|uniref:Beta-hexosaminidase n=1 Tax=Brassica napus TaxID=3708 RepID=A0ABQ7ZX82_BRANA|nr:hypothetical protein HID58_060947 [Brassica napus]